MSESLFKVTSEIREAVMKIEFLGGEITDEISGELDILQQQLLEKTDSITAYARKLEGEINVASAELDRIKTIHSNKKKELERYNAYVKTCMDMLGQREIKGELSKVIIRKPSKVVNIVNESLVPLEYVTVEEVKKIDKNTLKAALKNGYAIEGVELVDGASKVSFK
jgi:hypothetical protein